MIKIPPEETIVEAIEALLDKRAPADGVVVYYAAGTLCMDWEDELGNPCLGMLEFMDENLSNRVKLLMSRLYIENKPKHAAFYQQALDIIEGRAK